MSSGLLNADTDRDTWLAERRKGIGASEIAAVMGISPWESPFSLYWRKVNGWSYAASAQMEWGTRLEDAIAQKYAHEHGDDWLVRPAGLMVGPEPWILGTPDRLLDTAIPGIGICGVLELKTAHSADEWGEPGTDDIPVYYRAQVQWLMLVVGVDWAHVAVLIRGSDYREYEVLRDETDIAAMVDAGREFMARIESSDPPDIDSHSATLATLKRLHPDLEDAEVEVDSDVAANFLTAVEMVRQAEQLKQSAEIQLRAAMGPAKRAVCGGERVASRSIYTVKESVRRAYTVDRLNPARNKESTDD